ncbi:hypothetical protein GCM10029978_120050 [Actinoallomurus acanthiterrae]
MAEGIQMAEQQVRMYPAQASRRHSLFSYCAWQATGRGHCNESSYAPGWTQILPAKRGIWRADTL